MTTLLRFGTWGLLLVFFNTAQAQWNVKSIDRTSVKTAISANGIFFNQNGKPAFELSPDSGKHFLNFGSLWLMGANVGTVYGSMTTSSTQAELWPGPVDTITGFPKDPADWNFVWRVTSEDIKYHKANFKNGDYVPIDAIANWPAAYVENNLNPVLAPFIDWDKDGKYNPTKGDYPNVPGDDNIYFIANDGSGEHQQSGTQKMGIQLLGMVYSTDHSPVDNTVFLRLYVINRSNRIYTPFQLGMYTSFQLGNETDNFCGTDVASDMVYGYNGDNDDEGINGFGSKLPLAGCVSLSQKLFASTAFTSSDSNRSFPTNAQEFSNVMMGLWRNGSPKTVGGNGNQSGLLTNFIYTNNSHPAFPDANWNDVNSGDGPGSRNMLSILQFDTLKPGGYKQIDFAFYAALQNENDLHVEVRNIRDDIIQFYEGKLAVNQRGINKLELYPNPIKQGEIIHISFSNFYPTTVEMYSSSGVQVSYEVIPENLANKFEIRCSENLPPGIYYLKASNNNTIMVRKLVVTAL